jgi:hypothetical protein
VIGGWVLDVPAVVGAAQRAPYPEAIVWTANETDGVLCIPAAVLAEASASIRATDRDVLAVILGLEVTVVPSLDQAAADAVGHLLAGAGEPGHVAVGHAVYCAIQRGWPLVTSRVTAARALDPTIELDPMP